MFRFARTASATVGSSTAHAAAAASASAFGAGPARASTAARLQSSGGKKRDLYEVLGVSKGASDSEIKKAYRKRAMETHPDKGGNKEEFAAVSEAYEVLSTPDKRSAYDRFGHDAANMGGMGGMGGMGNRSAEDIFADFFRQSGFGGGGQAGPPQVEDVDVKMSLTLEDLYSGTTKSVRVRRPAVCGDCRGEGTKSPGQKQQCQRCNGTGRTVQRVSMGPGMVQQVVSQCQACDGAGTSIKPEDRCKGCRGEGFKMSSDSVAVSVPPGVPDGAVLVMQGAGGDKPGCVPGDLRVHLEMTPHRMFKRRGDDLILERNISLVEALTGLHLRVTLPDGRAVTVKTEEGKPLKHNGVLAVMHEGMPKYQRGGRGHLYIVTKVVMPTSLTPEQREALEKVFGKAHREDEAPSGTTIAAKPMRESYEELQQAKAADWNRDHGAGGYGGSRRRGPGGPQGGPGQGVECAQS